MSDESLKDIIKMLEYKNIIISNYKINLNNSSNIKILKKIAKLEDLDFELKKF